MTLIIGGRGQGKLDYVRAAFGVPEKQIGTSLGETRVVYGVQEIVRTLLELGEDPTAAVLAHAAAHPETIYLCDEVGCGVVPVDPGQRAWREAVGRCCVALAAQADRVERIFCGLPMVLKPC